MIVVERGFVEDRREGVGHVRVDARKLGRKRVQYALAGHAPGNRMWAEIETSEARGLKGWPRGECLDCGV